MSKLGIRVVAITAGLLLLVTLYLQGTDVSARAFLLPNVIASAIILGAVGYDRFLWKWPLINKLPGTPRLIHGTWKGSVISEWIDPKTKKPFGELEAYLVIRQTRTTVSACLHTERLQSHSLTADLGKSASGTPELSYIYQGVPKQHLQKSHPVQNGAATLQLIGNPVQRLIGSYWTNKDSRGEMKFEAKTNQIYEDFASAKAGVYS